MALTAKGEEDRFLFNAECEETWDARKRFLREPYTMTYDELDVEVDRNDESTDTVTFAFRRQGHANLVNDVDLVLSTDEDDVGKIIKRVDVRIGSQRIDGWQGTDVGTLIQTMCAVFERKVSRHGSSLFVPLALSPFHSHNLLSLVGIVDQKVVIEVEFAPGVVKRTSESAKLYGRTYFLSSATRLLARSYDMGIAEVQWGDDHPKPKHLSCVKHHLSFDHPASMLVFWGVDCQGGARTPPHRAGRAVLLIKGGWRRLGVP